MQRFRAGSSTPFRHGLRSTSSRSIGYAIQPAGIEGEVKLIAAITMENIADSVLADGFASRAELDGVIADLYAAAEDRRTVMSLPRVVQAWGYRR